LNYRHAFHAGNFADIVKHAAVLLTLQALQGGGAPLTVIDTHAGGGLYDLTGGEARKSGEAAAGVGRLMEGALPTPLEPLRAAVRRANRGGRETRFYPGSPWLIAEALRPGDRYLGFELRPEEQRALAENLKSRQGAATRCADGFAEAPAACPATGEVLVLIDPPFERPDDYPRIVEATAAVKARNPSARLLIWAPLKDLETFDAFLRDLEDAAPGPMLVAETRLRPLADPMKMNGCALVFVDPPPGLEAPLAQICAFVGAPPGEGRVWSV